MARILQLSPHVADLIAAGEVVERPGSVVKELVENAIDAGAKHITVEIQNGGMTLIRITDDGCGMDRQDAQTAFLRHATSKLRTEEDLAAIGTLGFRGEALAAISSVSRIDLLTCPAGAEGTAISLDGGTITRCEAAGCPKGTTIVVRDLFFNTPARLKFMKSDMAEASNVTAIVQRLSIAHPEIAFRLLKDGQETLRTAGDGQLLSAVAAVFGRQAAREMIPVEGHWEKTTVSGFVSKPTATRGSRSWQVFFVNGRFVRSRTMTAALEEAYRNRIMSGRFPSCVLNIELPLTAVDVNVHPAKTEVRFLSEKGVFDSIHYAVLSALAKDTGRKDVAFPAPKAPAEAPAPAAPTPAAPAQRTPAPQPIVSAAPKKEFFRQMSAEDYKAMAAAMGKPAMPSRPMAETLLPKEAPKPMAELHSEVMLPAVTPKPAPPKAEEAPVQEEIPLREAPTYRVVGEVLDCYIIVEEADAVLLIDKHAAHERMLFEKLKKQDTRAMSQLLLAPISADLAREEAAVLLENTALLRDCGYEIEEFGDGTVLIRAIPDDVDEADAEATLAALATDLLGGKRTDPDALRDELLHTIACKAAIKGGWHTEPAERDALVREVMTRDDLKYCPHGRPVCIRMTESSLRRQFKRS
ncbi:MAG: DNA mismatch repair endonuclease MutL [Oscillospiraceae bacterium]|nr:DNA mismatch repair endonuclease MutL [Oscillospiraceae bacterium]